MEAAAPDPSSPTKGRAVRSMFAAIAPRYDLLNRVLSLGLDQRWRRALVARLPELRPGDRVLDLCTGTGDLALALQRDTGAEVAVHASDFCEEMVVRAPAKSPDARDRPRYSVGDALALPYADGSFTALSVAFGLRNVQDVPAALGEMARVLRPGGRLLVLEFSRPTGLFSLFYKAYVFGVLPLVGRLVSGHGSAYTYLPASVWAFAGPRELADALGGAGLQVIEQRPFLGGAVMLHVADRPGA